MYSSNRYVDRSLVTSGLNGDIFFAYDTHKKRDIVIKSLSVNSLTDSYYREVGYLQKLKHPNIIKMYDYDSDMYSITLEKMDCDLLDYVSQDISGSEALRCFMNLCKAVSYCHSKKIAHLDIKPENVLVSKDRKSIKLCDFGGCCKWKSGCKYVTDYNSTEAYSAPETFTDPAFLGDKADIWSLGIVLHVVMTKNWPCQGETEEIAIKNLEKGNIVISSSFPKELVPLLNWILSITPTERPTVNQIMDTISQMHPVYYSPKIGRKGLKSTLNRILFKSRN